MDIQSRHNKIKTKLSDPGPRRAGGLAAFSDDSKRAVSMSAEDDLLTYWRRQFKDKSRAFVVVVELAAIFTLHGSQRQARLQYNMIRELAERHRGRFFVLAKGDLAVAVRRETADALMKELHDWVLKDAQLPEESIRRRVIPFQLPERLGELREAIALYAGGAAVADQPNLGWLFGANEGGNVQLKGPLAPSMLDRVEYQIMRSDIRPFVQRQTIFKRPTSERQLWTPRIQERRIGIAKLRETIFPDLEIDGDNPMFGQFCRILDERMLHHIMMGKTKLERKVSLNVSLATIFDRVFDTFLTHLADESRENLLIEINCGEIFKDIAAATSAISRLRRNGLGVIVDGMSLELLPYVRVDKLDYDYLKVLLPRERMKLLSSDSRIKALRKLSPDRVILGQCDHASAIKVGETLGIEMYQGWLLDQYEAADAL